MVTPGVAGPYTGVFPAGLINPDRNNFSPRIGLAWKVPHIKRSTIVRSGYGIYYNGQAYIPFGLTLGGAAAICSLEQREYQSATNPDAGQRLRFASRPRT